MFFFVESRCCTSYDLYVILKSVKSHPSISRLFVCCHAPAFAVMLIGKNMKSYIQAMYVMLVSCLCVISTL